jgi:predicted Zn finger-like uncharacterized protein
MPIRVTCPHCQTVGVVADEVRGKAVRCKKCGRPFAVGRPVPRAAPAVPPPARLRGRRFLVAAVLAGVLGAGVGFPAAYILLKNGKRPDDVVVAPGPTAPPDTGRQHDTPAAPTATRPEAPRDTAPKPPVAAPVEWKDFTSREGRFSARFPGPPQTTSEKNPAGGRVQTFTASVNASPGARPTSFTVSCSDLDPTLTAEPAAFLDAAAADVARGSREKTAVKLGGFPGVELRGEETNREGDVYLTTQRLCLVRARLYHVIASGPRDRETPALFTRFFDSFTLLDTEAPAPPVVDKPRPEKPAPPVVEKPRPAEPPKVTLASLRLTLPDGWQADYNKFLAAWEVTKPPPTPRSSAEVLRIEECPQDARTPDDYPSRLKEKDFLNIDVPGWVEVGKKEDLPDGFLFKGVVKKFSNPKTPPTLGFVAVRDVGGMKLRCFSANLRDEKSRDEALELFEGAKFARLK